MAQHDYVIANGTGAAVRSDLNNALAAIVSQNSGSTAPATTYAYQWWADTTASVLKLRNAANDGWIEVCELDGEFGSKTFNGNVTLNAQGDLRFGDSDSSNWVAFQSPATVASNVTWTLPSADGTNGQMLTTNGTGTLSWTTASASSDIITEGNTSAEVVDTGSDGHFKVTTEGTERLRVNSNGRLGVGTASPSVELHVSNSEIARVAIGSSYPMTLYTDSSGAGEDPGIFWINSKALRFSTSPTGISTTGQSEKARITSSGQLLVGTSTARSNFFNTTSVSPPVQVEGISNNTAGLSIVRNDNGSDSPKLYFGKTRGAAVGGTTIVQSGDDVGLITFQGSDGSEFVEAASISVTVDGTPGSNDMPGRLVFSTTADGASSPTERMRITNGGLMLVNLTSSPGGTSHGIKAVGTSSSNYGLIVQHDDTGDSVRGISSIAPSCTTADGFLYVGQASTGIKYAVRTDGDVQNTNNSYGAYSDIKLKENIVDASSQWDDIKSIRVRKYNLKSGQGHTQIGVIAQEVELISPGLVGESPDFDAQGKELDTTTKSVNYSVLYMKAVKALQEAMERIEQLEAEMAEVKAQLS